MKVWELMAALGKYPADHNVMVLVIQELPHPASGISEDWEEIEPLSISRPTKNMVAISVTVQAFQGR